MVRLFPSANIRSNLIARNNGRLRHILNGSIACLAIRSGSSRNKNRVRASRVAVHKVFHLFSGAFVANRRRSSRLDADTLRHKRTTLSAAA